jgi:hypothetical protein
MFKSKPNCFGKFNKNWTMCTEQCDFRIACRAEQMRFSQEGLKRTTWGRPYGDVLAETEAFNKEQDQKQEFSEKGFYTNNGKRVFGAPKIKPIKRMPRPPLPKARPVPPKPRTKLMRATMEPYTAQAFDRAMYSRTTSVMEPSEVCNEYSWLLKEQNEEVREYRMKTLEFRIIQLWESWERFFIFYRS